jgi:hypothetical protein
VSKAPKVVCLDEEEEVVKEEEEEEKDANIAPAVAVVATSNRLHQWACIACTFVQEGTEAACALCQTPREIGKEEEDQEKEKKDNDRKKRGEKQARRGKEVGKEGDDQNRNRVDAFRSAVTTKSDDQEEKEREAGSAASGTNPHKRQKTLFAFLPKKRGVYTHADST